MRLAKASFMRGSFGSKITRAYASTSTAPDAIPSESDVVVVGGGAIGLSVMYHLVKQGCKKVVLLERDRLTSGTSWHAAGILWLLRGSESESRLSRRTRSLMYELKEEHGLETGWIESGSLFVASKADRWTEYLKMASFANVTGVKTEVLTPSDVKKLYPIMNVNDLQGAVYSPNDGNIDPSGYCEAMAKVVKKNGGKIFTNCSVNSIETIIDQYGAKRVTGVVTSQGKINTKTVVNCAGLWSSYVSNLVGSSVPLMPLKHAYIQTEKVEGAKGLPNVRDQDSSFYIRSVGEDLVIGGYEANPEMWDEVKHHDFSFSLFDFKWETFDVTMKGAIRRVPTVEKAGIKTSICGPESFTVDSRPVLGETPDVRGFWVAAGLSSSGMMLSGGVGEQMAKWILNGRPDFDLYKYDIRRYPSWLINRPGWIRERCHEVLATKYSLKWHFDEPLAGRNVAFDSLYERQLKAGAVFQQRGGYERPAFFAPDLGPAPVPPYDFYGAYDNPTSKKDYADRLKLDYTWQHPAPSSKYITPEIKACREKVGLINMSYFGQFYLYGPDATKAADYIFSADVSGQRKDNHDGVVYSCLLDNQGKIVNDVTVCKTKPAHNLPMQPNFADPEAYYIAASGTTIQQSFSWIKDRLQDGGFKAWLVDYTPHLGIFSVQGPNSRQLLSKVVDGCDLGDDAFPYLTHKLAKFAGHTVRLLRVSYVGELGWEIHAPMSALPDIYDALLKSGKDLGIRQVGFRAVDLLSFDKGIKHWGEDISLDDTPLEAGIAFTAKLNTSKDFIGRAALEEQRKIGLKRRLVQFATANGDVPLFGHEPVFRNGIYVGSTRRAGYSETLKCFLGAGYLVNNGGIVTADWIKEGKHEIEVSPGKRVAVVAQLKPFFDAENKRVRGIYN